MSPAADTDPAPAAVDPFAPATLGPVTLRNRFVKAATFEGLTTKDGIGDDLIDFHTAFAAGGVGLTTLAFAAVAPEARGAPDELILRPSLAPGLERFTNAVTSAGAKASIQIGHSGPVGVAVRGGGLAPSRTFAPQALKFAREATDGDLDAVVDQFGEAAALAAGCGFSVVELHYGHGYLVSSFLSPRLNRRRDRWGGSVEGRALLARRIAERVRERTDPSVAVIAKLNMADGVRGGLWLDDSVATALLLEADGHLDALELTGGSSFQNPMYLFRGEAPVAELAAAMPPLIGLGLRLTASWMMPSYPFEEAFFLPYARQFRAALSMPLILLGGIDELDTVHRAMQEGFAFVAMARALLREPDLVDRWRQGSAEPGRCVHCNKCVPSIYTGTHCVLVPEPDRPGLRVRDARAEPPRSVP